LRVVSVPLRVIEEVLELADDASVRPFVAPRLRMPCVAVNVSCSAPPPACESVTLIAFPLAVEKTSDESSLTEAVAGAVTFKDWLTGLTVMVAVAVGPPRPAVVALVDS
jgi:hypothetical protein